MKKTKIVAPQCLADPLWPKIFEETQDWMVIKIGGKGKSCRWQPPI